MATLAYLTGGESPTADRMTEIFTEFDAKLAKLLAGGKSPLLAQTATMPAQLLGKVFNFTTLNASSATVYAQRAGGPQTAGGAAVAYNHSMFTNALAAIDTSQTSTAVTWDHTNRLCIVPKFPTPVDPGHSTDSPYLTGTPGVSLAYEAYMGFLEHSLQCHTVQHQGPSDTSPQTYYVQEVNCPPEKRFKFALAEIVVEGPTSINLPVAWDKYSCFRIHNLNGAALTVTFGLAYTLTVPAFGCQTVRRDMPGTNFRLGGHYFFDYEPGDPRFLYYQRGYYAGGNVAPGAGPRATNAMAANNLTNPMVLHDWVEYLSINKDALAGLSYSTNWGQITSGVYARFIRDQAVLYDAYPLNDAQFGDPSNPATLVGDLIHHKGKFLLAKNSKTLLDPVTGYPLVTFEWVTFRGYATIVADFAGHKITVAPNASGDLVLSTNDPDNWLAIVPISTNMFKNGTSYLYSATGDSPPLIKLSANDFGYPHFYPYTLENLVFENPGSEFTLANTAPNLCWQRALVTADNTRTWNPPAGGSTVVTGDPTSYVQVQNSNPARRELHGIHSKTVADLLNLSWWGDKDRVSQSTIYGTYTNQALKLTQEGLVLTFDETITGIRPNADSNGLASGDPARWATGQLTRTQVVKFRGHGWGWAGANGGKTVPFHSPRYPNYRCPWVYQGEVTGLTPGADFDYSSNITATAGWLGLLRRQAAFATATTDKQRFFHEKAPWPDGLPDNLTSTAWKYYYDHNGIGLGYWTQAQLAVALLPELYNGMARAVNSLTQGYALTAAALSFRLGDGRQVSLAPTREDFPVPMQCFATMREGSALYDLCVAKSITVRDFATVGDDYDVTQYDHVGSLAGAVLCMADPAGNYSTTDLGGMMWQVDFSGTLSLSLTPLALTGGWDPGTASSLPHDTGPFGYSTAASGTYHIVGNAAFPDWAPSYFIGGWWDGWTSVCMLPGDVVVTVVDYPSFATRWVLINRQRWNPGGAMVNYNNTLVLLTPSGIGDVASRQTYVPALTYLGTWDPNTAPPASLTSDRADLGKYYDVSADGGGYVKGNRTIWDGYNWQRANAAYDGLKWVSIADVKTMLEGMGFDFVYAEFVVPLELTTVTGQSLANRPGAVTSASWTGSGFSTYSPGGAPSFNTENVQGCYVDTTLLGRELRFIHNMGATSKWKKRLASLPDPTSGPALVNIKSYTGGPPLLFQWETGWSIYDGHTLPPPDNKIKFHGVGSGTPTVIDGYSASGPAVDKKIVQAKSEPAAYQYMAYAILQNNSSGVTGSAAARLISAGAWSPNGDWWSASATNYARASTNPSPPYAPYVWHAATEADQTITAANGVTMLAAPALQAAYALATSTVNVISL